MIPTLPDELVGVIVQAHSHAPATIKERREHLRSLSLVSSVWRLYAQEELTRNIWLAGGMEGAARLCAKLENPDDRRRVRSLCVDDVSAMEHELPEFSRVIALCSETVTTCWIGYSVGFSLFPLLQPLQHLTTLHLHESEFAISRDVCLPTLQRLCLTVHALWRVDYTLLSPLHFPSLTSLALCGSGHRLTNSMPELEKLVRQLSTLVIGSVRNVDADLSGLPLPILENCVGLRRLVFGDGMTNLDTTLLHLPSKLQSLHILIRTTSEGPRAVEYLIKSPPPCLSELRYLSLRGDAQRFNELTAAKETGLDEVVKVWEERKVWVSTGGMEQSVYSAWDNFVE